MGCNPVMMTSCDVIDRVIHLFVGQMIVGSMMTSIVSCDWLQVVSMTTGVSNYSGIT